MPILMWGKVDLRRVRKEGKTPDATASRTQAGTFAIVSAIHSAIDDLVNNAIIHYFDS